MKKPASLVLILIFGFLGLLSAQPAIKQTINSNWGFHKGDIAGFPAKK